MLASLRDAVLDGLALLLPVECAGCGAPDRAVCMRCRAALVPDASSRRLPDGTPVFSGLDYEGVAREVLLAYKEQGRTELARHLAPALAAAVSAAIAAHGLRGVRGGGAHGGGAHGGGARGGDVEAGGVEPGGIGGIEVVSVPATRRARRRRGFDPVAALVARAGLDRARVFAPAAPHMAQKTLALEQRAVNLAGVFAVRAPVAGRRFLLVDDVVTTGATLQSAAAALRDAGAEVVAAAAVASTPRLFGSSIVSQRERSAPFP